ncbi:MAG: efflux RND transporter periplasmic adaptor subunit [Holosporales bacterium]|jgi:multidrug efflux system membrane fusion protein|nr:efflux RND transporter periplasmic adaptor subunit [Holosporales bacterium]
MIKQIMTKRTLIVIGVLAVWFVANSLLKKTEHTKNPACHDKQTVRFKHISAESFNESINIKGYTTAWKNACLKARTSGEIKKVHVVCGEKVKKGQLLVELSDDARAEKLAQARSQAAARRLEYNASSKMGHLQYHSRSEVANKKALYYSALFDEKQAELDLEFTKIAAPFSGVVNSIDLNEGASVTVAVPVISVAELDPMKVVAFCSNKDISKIKVDQSVTLNLDGIKREISGQVIAVSHVADSQTRNYKVEIKIDNPNDQIADGMAVSGKIIIGSAVGFFIPSSAIVLSDDGALGIKIINDDNKPEFIPVSIVSMQDDGAWISGPQMKNLKLITVGQDYVIDGEEIAYVPE